jgi:protein-disulfide isomerase
MNLAMSGITPKYVKCHSAINAHNKMAEKLNIEATPIFILDDGRELIGYRSPEELFKSLN